MTTPKHLWRDANAGYLQDIPNEELILASLANIQNKFDNSDIGIYSKQIALDSELMGGDYWTEKVNLSFSDNVGALAFSLNGYSYYGGKTDNSVIQYNDTFDNWSTQSQTPINTMTSGTNFVYNGFGYHTHGHGGSYLNNTYQYSDSTHTFTSKIAGPNVGRATAGFNLQNMGYVIGGYNGSYYSYVDQYDIENDVWATKSNNNNSTWNNPGITINGVGYMIHGSKSSVAVSIVERYEEAIDNWETKENTSNYWTSTTFSLNGFGYWAGADIGATTATSTGRQYHEGSDSWSIILGLPVALRNSRALELDNFGYHISGINSSDSTTSFHHQYRNFNLYKIPGKFKSSAKIPKRVFVGTNIDGKQITLPIHLRTNNNYQNSVNDLKYDSTHNDWNFMKSNEDSLIKGTFKTQNLLRWSEDFSNPLWTGAAIVTNYGSVAPDGSLNANTLNDNDATAGVNLGKQQAFKIPLNTTIVYSVYLKQGTAATTQIKMWDSLNVFYVHPIITWSGPSINAGTLEDVGDGWYRATTPSLTYDLNTNFNVIIWPTAWTAGSSTGTVHAWGAQVTTVESKKYERTESSARPPLTLDTDAIYEYEARVGIPSYVAGVGAGTWISKANMLTSRYSYGGASLNGFGYSIGGFDTGSSCTTEKYNNSTNTWLLVQDLVNDRYGIVSGSLNGFIYSFGGNDTIRKCDVEQYNDENNTWTAKQDMINDRYLMATATLNGFAYVYGGDDATLNRCWTDQYNDSTDAWLAKTDMNNDRTELAGASLNGFMYNFGGFDGAVYHCSTEKYNDADETWTDKQDMINDRRGMGGESLNGFIYSYGGYDGSNRCWTEQYNDAADLWIAKQDMINDQRLFATATLNKFMYSFGGHDGSGHSWVEQYSLNEPYSKLTVSMYIEE